MVGYLGDKFGMADGGTVDTHLVSSSVEQTVYVLELIDATPHGKRDVDFRSYAGNHVSKGLASLETRRDVEEYQFVGSCIAVCLSQFYRVSCAPEVHEVSSLNGFSVLDIQTGDDSFCQTFVLPQQFRRIDPALVKGFPENHRRDACCFESFDVIIAGHATTGYQV